MTTLVIRLPILGNPNGRIMETFHTVGIVVPGEIGIMLIRYEAIIPQTGTAEVYELGEANHGLHYYDYKRTGPKNWEMSDPRHAKQLPLFPGE
jgi:hypothetical protein